MKKLLTTFILLTFLNIISCAPIMSPAIKLKNSSENGEIVRNMRVVWNGYYLLDQDVGRCGVAEQNFNLKKESDFFGPVHIEWENALGKKLTKDINFTKKDFPTFSRSAFGPHIYHYVVLYFTQDDVEIYTSDNPRIKEIRKEKAEDWRIIGGICAKYCSPEYIKKGPLAKDKCKNHKNFKK